MNGAEKDHAGGRSEKQYKMSKKYRMEGTSGGLEHLRVSRTPEMN